MADALGNRPTLREMWAREIKREEAKRAERDALAAEVERLTQRKFDLETEVFSLREALRQITLEPYEDVSGLDQGCLNLHEARTIARSALSREDARNA